MDSIVIEGGIPLIGNIKVSGSKNASLPIMVASLLTDEPIILSNIPILSDITTMKQLLANHGTFVEEQAKEESLILKIESRAINNFTAPYEIVRKMRASIWVLGPLLTRFGKAKVSLPGGCAIGARQVDLHIAVLAAMGADISVEEGYIKASAKRGRLRGCEFSFAKSSVGATINAILAAVLARGDSILSNCAIEPEIVDLCKVLIKMGAKIEGVGTRELSIAGRENLHGCTHDILPDRIEAGTYMIAAAITGGDLKISGINYHIVENLTSRLSEAGVNISHTEDVIHVRHKGEIRGIDITTQPYPGFSTDLQAQFMSLMTLCTGSSIITEDIFENRFMHVPELCRMGANISITGNSALVRGVKRLSGAEVMASDLRASVSLVIAGLAANGKTKIRRVYHLDRGYQMIEQKLANCGANIQRVYGDLV